LGDVELEEVFHENRMNDEGEWFLLERESVSHMLAKSCGGNPYADVGLRMESQLHLFRNPFFILIR
jgi:hypothetical protein